MPLISETLAKKLEEGQDWTPKLVCFACNWCTYAGADLAGSNRRKYPPEIRLLRVPCSARVDVEMVLKAFERGADGVMVAGCHPGDCHYSSGNYHTRRRMTLLGKLLEFIGIAPERFRFEWISAAEGDKFAQVAQEFVTDLTELGPRNPAQSQD